LRRVVAGGFAGLLLAAILSCGSSSSSNQHKVSGIKFRAFVSNPLLASGTSNVPSLNIVNASNDTLAASAISLSGETQPGLMALSPDLRLTLVFSALQNSVAVIDNTTESTATNIAGGSISNFTLPGATESMFVAGDNVTAYAAVPTASVQGQSPGAVVAMNLRTGTIKATIPVPGARFVVGSPDGDNILVFSDESDSITILKSVLIGTNQDPRTTVTGFDRPVWAIFLDSNSTLIFNCGPECGGTAAGIATFDLTNSGPTSTLPVSGATYGTLVGTTLYVAGTPPNTPCGSGTSATICGTLNLVDTNSFRVTNANPIIIPDGFHNRMAMGADGQLFVGSRGCTSINITGGEVRGCLSIYNTSTNKVVVPPQIGDATGIAPVPGREIVYACEGGVFQIFDTTTDQLLVQTHITDIVGDSIDVKIVDPPPN